jgi:hypothetical protein
MRFPDDDGLPLWAFVLVILLTTISAALIGFLVWRKCTRRSNRRTLKSLEGLEPPERQVSVKKGKLVRASWNFSLTGSKFGQGSTHKHSPSHSHQWPETPYFTGHLGSEKSPSMVHSAQDMNGLRSHQSHLHHASWSRILQRESRGGLRIDVGRLQDEESPRQFCISDWLKQAQELSNIKSRIPVALKTPRLDSPPLLSPITPLTLPRTPRNQEVFPTSLPLFSNAADIPPMPAMPYPSSRYVDASRPLPDLPFKEIQQFASRFSSSSHYDTSHFDQYHSSTATTDSFLNAWSSAYHEWLARSDTSASSLPFKEGMPRVSHIETASIASPVPEADDEHETNASWPDLTPVVSAESALPMQQAESFVTISTESDKRGRSGNKCARPPLMRGERSWLEDS